MKKFIALSMAIIMLTGSLCGCGSESQPIAHTEETENAEKTEKTVISLISTYMLPEFEAALENAHPEIDLKVEKMATGTINGEAARRLRKGHGTDLIITNLPFGEIADYTYDLSAEGFVEKYQSATMKSIAINGQSRYIPLPGSYCGYIINKTLVDRLGLPLPETQGDLLNILAAAKDKGLGVTPDTGYGFGISEIGATFYGAYYTAGFATDYLSTADGVKWLSAFADKAATFAGTWEHSVDFLKSCVDNGYVDPDKLIVFYNGHFETDTNAFKAEDYFPDRMAIVCFGDLEMYRMICEKTEDEIVMLPCLPPDASGCKLLSAVSNKYIAVNDALSQDEEKLRDALTVLDFLSTEEGQSKWIEDSSCPHSFLNEFSTDSESLPVSIHPYVKNEMIFSNPFPTNLLSYIGKNLTSVAKGKMGIDDALREIDAFYLDGSPDVEYDLSVVGTIVSDMLCENANVRLGETEIGNFISDAVREMTGADVALVNSGGIRSSFYKGDITGEDLTAVCPYSNLIIVAKTDGATLRAALTNGVQKTWKPAGQFLQVSGIRYSFKPALNETETAELISLTYADGTDVKDDDQITVAYTNYMGGSSGYVDAGDGFTMLNVYDTQLPVTVELIKETNKTYRDALKEYFNTHKDEEVSAAIEGRITIVD